MVARLEEVLGGRTGPARLIRGDFWANNIMVDPNAPGGIALRAFVDLPAAPANALDQALAGEG